MTFIKSFLLKKHIPRGLLILLALILFLPATINASQQKAETHSETELGIEIITAKDLTTSEPLKLFSLSGSIGLFTPIKNLKVIDKEPLKDFEGIYITPL